MPTLEQTRLKEQILEIENRWKDKPHDEIVAHCKWRGDMMIKRNLKRKLRKLGVVDDIFGGL